MTQVIISPSVSLVNGIPTVTSLDIAGKFGKRHCDVLRAIQKIITELFPEFTERNFALSDYTDETGRKLPMFNLTRDAFSLVVMGFTGKEALAWKVRYIEAFNAMEAALTEKARRKAIAARRNPAPFLDCLGLSPYEKVLMGPQVRAMLDNEEEVGSRTLECILIKAKYMTVLAEVARLGREIAADLERTSLAGQVARAVNPKHPFTDPFVDTLLEDGYRLARLGNDFHDLAFRALNNNICMAKMLEC